MAGRKAALAAAKAQATETRLARIAPPASGAWARAARGEALERVRALGLPDRRDEYWRYTDPATFAAETPVAAELFDAGDETAVFDAVDRLRLVFVDGVFDPAQSDSPALAGVEIERLADAARRDIHWARDVYGRLEAAGQSPVPRPLAALNTATATDGVVIRVTGAAAKPVALVYQRGSDAAARGAEAVLHHVVRLDPGAEFTLLESGPGAARFSSVLEVDVADGARFHHVRAQGRDHQRRMVTHLFGRVGAGALLKSFTLSANGALTRNEIVVRLAGEGGTVHVAGAAVGDGAFHHDDTVFITHGAPRCESRQVFKKVLRHGAVGVFQGKILVEQPAQLTDGYQISQSLLLDEDAQFLAKPELEIYADDVKCSHGSTSGEIDAQHLFYLRARGVPLDDAMQLLVMAFVAEALGEIEDERLADDIRMRMENWLRRHRS